MCTATCACKKGPRLAIVPRPKTLGDFVATPNFGAMASGWNLAGGATSSSSSSDSSSGSGNAAINPFTTSGQPVSPFFSNPFTPFVQAADQAVQAQNQSSILDAFHNIATVLSSHQQQLQALNASSAQPGQPGQTNSFQQWWGETSAISSSLTNGNLVEIGLGVFAAALAISLLRRRRK